MCAKIMAKEGGKKRATAGTRKSRERWEEGEEYGKTKQSRQESSLPAAISL
jgi:hypothetical protein